MTNWKLPKHLEPYREYIGTYYIGCSLEQAIKLGYDDLEIQAQVNLLQHLYDAGKLK